MTHEQAIRRIYKLLDTNADRLNRIPDIFCRQVIGRVMDAVMEATMHAEEVSVSGDAAPVADPSYEPWQAGFDARTAGAGDDVCPERRGTYDRWLWMQGYESARSEEPNHG